MEIADFCREIEAYLCRKNDGHLIRVTGPSFDLVAGWASQGVPLKIAFQGIDRYFERYYRHGPRRRPVKIDFCAADVLDVFDDWRRATGLVLQSPATPEAWKGHQSAFGGHRSTAGSREVAALGGSPVARLRQSLPAHLERVVLKLSSARASGALGAAADDVIDRVARELDEARAEVNGIRGERRRQLVARLVALDAELIAQVRATIDESACQALEREADEELAPFRATMTTDAMARAREGAINRLVRERFRLPLIAFE